MQRYRDFSPTPFDATNLNGEYHGISDFWIVPVSHTRDSGPLDESNFAAALRALGGESDTVQVHRFGHWGPGWYELILVDPNDTAAVQTAEELEASLADYPVLDDEDLSARETEETEQYCANCSISERVKYLQHCHESIFAARAGASDLFARAPRTYDYIRDRAISNY